MFIKLENKIINTDRVYKINKITNSDNKYVFFYIDNTKNIFNIEVEEFKLLFHEFLKVSDRDRGETFVNIKNISDVNLDSGLITFYNGEWIVFTENKEYFNILFDNNHLQSLVDNYSKENLEKEYLKIKEETKDLWLKDKNISALPKYVYKHGKGFKSVINGVYIGRRKTVEEVQLMVEEYLKEHPEIIV